MRGVIEWNGWRFAGRVRLKPGLYSDRYVNRDLWTAERVYRGRDNLSMGLLVKDEKGKVQGLVQEPKDLP